MKIISKSYKKIISFFFLFLYGKISFKKIKLNKDFTVKKKIFKNRFYKFFEINKCRIYTNTSDVAYIKNNLIISGPSIQLRDNYNQHVKHNVVIKKGTPKFYKKINYRVFSLLCGVDANNNYYHWFFDCLPKFLLFSKFYNFNKNDFFLLPNLKHDYQIQSLKILKIKNILNGYDLKHIKAKKIISLNFFYTINHQDWLIQSLRKKFILSKKKTKKPTLKIFINREGINSLTRDIFEKEKLIKFLKKNNFLLINPSKLSFIDEVKLFNSAKIVIGVHGAALTNVIFCQNKTHIIELKNNKSDYLYENIIKKSKLNHYSLVSKKITSNSSSRSCDGLIEVNLLKLSKILSNIK